MKIYVQLKNFEMLEKLEWNVIIRHIITWNVFFLNFYVKIVGIRPIFLWCLTSLPNYLVFFSFTMIQIGGL
jgi:hypothetical protein